MWNFQKKIEILKPGKTYITFSSGKLECLCTVRPFQPCPIFASHANKCGSVISWKHSSFFRHFISLSANGGIRTIHLRIVSQVFYHSAPRAQTGNPYRRRTVDLLVLTSLDQLLFLLNILFIFFLKQATLMRGQSVQSLSRQLVFLGTTLHS